MTIQILYPHNNPTTVPVGELIGCLNVWVSLFKPQYEFTTCSIPRYATQLSLNHHLNRGLHRVFGLDVILRSITQSYNPHIQRQDTKQATLEFVDQNAMYLNICDAQSLNGNTVEGVRLTQAAIAAWYQYPRSVRLMHLSFGIERLNYILQYVDINIDNI